jgi:hypothetical protein
MGFLLNKRRRFWPDELLLDCQERLCFSDSAVRKWHKITATNSLKYSNKLPGRKRKLLGAVPLLCPLLQFRSTPKAVALRWYHTHWHSQIVAAMCRHFRPCFFFNGRNVKGILFVIRGDITHFLGLSSSIWIRTALFRQAFNYRMVSPFLFPESVTK